jgi:DNA repair exonuclease SbcCD ATPase subunit
VQETNGHRLGDVAMEIEHLKQQLREKEEELDDCKKTNAEHSYLQSSPSYLSLSTSYRDVLKQLNSLESENEELRSCIAAMHEGTGPIHDERYFQTKIGNLEHQIKDWAMQYTPTDQEWDYIKTDTFLRRLESLTDGRASAQSVKGTHRKYELFRDIRTRRLFYRHFISLALCQHLFSQFAVGLDSDDNTLLNKIHDTIVKHGDQLARQH